MQELWSRVAFSILISNTDDHLRNHGFLQAGRGGWTLSPLFDVNPNPDPGPKFLSTAIDFDDAEASIDTLIAVADFRLDQATARTILGRVSRAVVTWAAVAVRTGIAAAEIARMGPAFEHEQARIAERLASQA